MEGSLREIKWCECCHEDAEHYSTKGGDRIFCTVPGCGCAKYRHDPSIESIWSSIDIHEEVKSMAKQEENAWKKIESGARGWNDGDVVQGVLVGKEQDAAYDNFIYKVKCDDGSIETRWGSTILNSLMAQVEIGKKVRIVYLGISPNSKPGMSPAKLFEVYTQ
jgi:hypothetical protein